MRFANTFDATAGLAPPLAELSKSGLVRRVASSLVLAPPTIAAVYAGHPYFEAVLALAAFQMGREWSRLCNDGAIGIVGYALAAASACSVVVGAWAGAEFGMLLAASGALVIHVVARGAATRRPAWTALGILIVALPCDAFLWLRYEAPNGVLVSLWLLLVVWATDIGAYAAGRSIGGPRLWPSVSPRKTWAGLVGGVVAASVVSYAMAWLIDHPDRIWWALLASGLAVVAQAGDLAESAVKRRFGAKDSGRLIPGHGGLLDRVDGLIASVPAMAVVSWLAGPKVLAWP
jgi:phosphatidate cytidylyltransferase